MTNMVVVWQEKCASKQSYWEIWLFLWSPRASVFRKVLVQEGHANPTPKCCAHVHRYQPVRLVALTALLNPAFVNPFDTPNCRWRGAMWVGMATSRAGVTAEEGASDANSTSLTAGMETSGTASLGSWGGSLEMEAVRAWWHFWGGVGQRTQGNEIKLPSRAHTDPLP